MECAGSAPKLLHPPGKAGGGRGEEGEGAAPRVTGKLIHPRRKVAGVWCGCLCAPGQLVWPEREFGGHTRAAPALRPPRVHPVGEAVWGLPGPADNPPTLVLAKPALRPGQRKNHRPLGLAFGVTAVHSIRATGGGSRPARLEHFRLHAENARAGMLLTSRCRSRMLHRLI